MPRIYGKLPFIAAMACSAAAMGMMPAPATAQDQPTSAQASQHPYLSVDRLREMYGDAQSKYMKIGGLTIHYKDEGPRDAPVLLMVHGSESSMRTYDRET